MTKHSVLCGVLFFLVCLGSSVYAQFFSSASLFFAIETKKSEETDGVFRLLSSRPSRCNPHLLFSSEIPKFIDLRSSSKGIVLESKENEQVLPFTLEGECTVAQEIVLDLEAQSSFSAGPSIIVESQLVEGKFLLHGKAIFPNKMDVLEIQTWKGELAILSTQTPSIEPIGEEWLIVTSQDWTEYQNTAEWRQEKCHNWSQLFFLSRQVQRCILQGEGALRISELKL